MGYTDQSALERYLQRALTTSEVTALVDLIPDATEYIDAETGRSWGPQTITGELHNFLGVTVQTNVSPVASIQRVSLRRSTVGDTPQVLAEGDNWELIDAASGLLTIERVPWWGWNRNHPVPRDWLVVIDYTVTAEIPRGIAVAATALVAYAVQAGGDRYYQAGIAEYQSGQDVRVKYRIDPTSVPDEVTERLRRFRPIIEFA